MIPVEWFAFAPISLTTLKLRYKFVKKYGEFHDGLFDGLLLDRASANVFVSTPDKEHFVLEISDVAAVDAGTFKEGNIIFDVLIYGCDELTLEQMIAVHGPMSEYGLPRPSAAVADEGPPRRTKPA